MRVWIDTDLALGAPGLGDVDDGFALAALLRAPSVEILGISTVFGNSRPHHSAEAARALLAGRKLEVLEGAERPGQKTRATDAIAALPEDSVILALGPLTNLVQARAQIWMVGGNLASWGHWPPLWPFEFNLAKDPEASRALFAAPLRRRLYTLDACRALTLSLKQLRQFAASPDPLAQHLARHSWKWLAYAPLRYRALGFPLWDLVPALDACGLLQARFDLRRLRFEGRGLLIPDAHAPETECLRHFDAASAWNAFQRLLRSGA